MKYPLITAIGVVLLSGICVAGEKIELKTENDRVNYSVGYQIGGDFKRQEVELNPQALVQGIEDALAGTEPLLTPDEMRTTLVDLKKRIVAVQQEKAVQAAMQNLEAARGLPGRKCHQGGCEEPGEWPAVQGHRERQRGHAEGHGQRHGSLSWHPDRWH
jgi:hypothetical protein